MLPTCPRACYAMSGADTAYHPAATPAVCARQGAEPHSPRPVRPFRAAASCPWRNAHSKSCCPSRRRGVWNNARGGSCGGVVPHPRAPRHASSASQRRFGSKRPTAAFLCCIPRARCVTPREARKPHGARVGPTREQRRGDEQERAQPRRSSSARACWCKELRFHAECCAAMCCNVQCKAAAPWTSGRCGEARCECPALPLPDALRELLPGGRGADSREGGGGGGATGRESGDGRLSRREGGQSVHSDRGSGGRTCPRVAMLGSRI